MKNYGNAGLDHKDDQRAKKWTGWTRPKARPPQTHHRVNQIFQSGQQGQSGQSGQQGQKPKPT
jgi:hypothetical protein